MDAWKTIVKALLVVAIPVTGLWIAEARKTSTELQPGGRLQEIRLQSANEQVLPSFDNGLPKAIVVFSASCPFCREQLKHCKALAKEWSGRIDILAVSTSDAEATRTLLRETEYDEPAAIAAQEDTWNQWRVKAVPTTILIDPRRIVVNSWKGIRSADEEREMYGLLAQTDVSHR
jgi:peroxiredoxin